MKDIQDAEVMELIVPLLTDRAGRFYIDDEEYKECFKKQEQVFEQLSSLLTKKQLKLLIQYTDCAAMTGEVIERLIYIQAMKDMFAVFQTLTKAQKDS